MSDILRARAVATANGTHIVIPIVKTGVTDFAVAADWTPATGDVKITKDDGTPANIATLPTYVTNQGWEFVFSATELTADKIDVLIVDAATKAIDDQFFTISTVGLSGADIAEIRHRLNLDGIQTIPTAGGAAKMAGTDAELTLKTLKIITDSGHAVEYKSTHVSGSASGLRVQSQSTSPAVSLENIQDGSGLYIKGLNSGDGIQIIAGASGAGMNILGGPGKAGIQTTGGTNAPGMLITGKGFAAGLEIDGGTGGGVGHGIEITGGSGGGDGINIAGGGTGHGIHAKSGLGATGDGMRVEALSTNGNGLNTIKTGSGIDLKASDHGDGSWEGGGSGDWTTDEKNQMRHRLNIDGTQVAPSVEGGGAGKVAGPNADLTLKSLKVIQTTATEPAVEFTGNTTGAGMLVTGGATGHGIHSSGGGTSGNGLHIEAQGGNDSAVLLQGSGSGSGLEGIGGTTGAGIEAQGGSTSGPGVLITGGPAGKGLYILGGDGGGGNAVHIEAQAGATSHGIRVIGFGSGHGIHAESGAGATGDGMRIEALSTNGNGLNVFGAGSGAGLKTTGGTTGNGAQFIGGATSGNGLDIEAQAGNSTGMLVQGSGSGAGMLVTGGATGAGIHAKGGATLGAGAFFEAQGGGSHGISAIGFGGGGGLNATGGATGHGIRGLGGATSGSGAIFQGQGTNSNGLETIKTGSGIDLKATDHGNDSWEGGDATEANQILILARTDTLPVKRNTAIADFYFAMFDVNGDAVLSDAANITAQVTKDGAALSAIAGSITEIGLGIYRLPLTAANTNFANGMYVFTSITANVLTTYKEVITESV